MAHSSTMEKLGSQAPDFELKNRNPLLEQEAYRLSSFEDQPSLSRADIRSGEGRRRELPGPGGSEG